MTTFSSAWVDGKITNIDELLLQNKLRKFLFILDTNFAIMARYYISDNEHFQQYYKSQEKDFFKTIQVIKSTRSKVVFAFACEEASRSKLTGNIDIDKYKLMVDCIAEIFNFKADNRLISNNENITEDIRFSKTPILLKNGLFKKQTVITYTTLLKAFIYKHFDTRDNKTRIKEMFHYLADKVNAYSPISTSFVIHYLGNEPSILKKVKPSLGIEEILNRIYAASIDMSLPTQASQLAEITNYSEVPIFVTFDKGIKLLFDSLLIEGEHRLENGKIVPKYSTMIFYSSGWNDADIQELCKYAQSVQLTNRRTVTNHKDELIRLNQLAGELEIELMKILETLSSSNRK